MHDGSDMDVKELWAIAPDAALDRLTAVACRTLDAPVALMSYFAAGQQHIRSAAGAHPAKQALIDRQHSMCRHVLESNAPILANSVQTHGVLGTVDQKDDAPAIQAYLGVPIHNNDGHAVGTLCVYDHRQRQWGPDDLTVLSDLAASGMAQIERKAEALSRRAAETALRTSETRLSAISDTILGIVFERRKTGPASWHYTFFGSSRRDVFGPREQAADSNAPLDLVHVEDRGRVLAALQHATFSETDLDITFRIAGSEAEPVRWLRSRSVVRHDADGTAVWDGLCFDITDLIVAREAVEAERLAKETLLVDVNHELRAPLQAILGYAELLMTESRPDVVQEHATTIQNAAQSLLSIVNQLLDLASGRDADTQAIERRPTAIRTVAEASHGMVAPLAAAKGIGSRLVVDADVPPSVLADGPKIQQVLVNLLANAVKFTDAGAVTLRVSRSATGLRFAVSDTGIGIADDKIDLLFRRFSRIEPDGRSARGTGLGLAIAKKLVEAMNGTIGVASDPACGTTFWFEIAADIVAIPVAEPTPLPEAAKRARIGARILIADDLDLNRKLIADMLSLEGHEIDCVCDGAAAVAAAAAQTYDLILMDMIMPVMDGIAATRAIRALPSPNCDVPIIALTAHAFKEQLDSCLAAGMDATLTKPMSLDALTATVRSWTQGRSQAA